VSTLVFSSRRAFGVALRVTGLTEGGSEGLALLTESVTVLTHSPALLERAHSLCELGAALRRAGQRANAREPLAGALELAARCGEVTDCLGRPPAHRVRAQASCRFGRFSRLLEHDGSRNPEKFRMCTEGERRDLLGSPPWPLLVLR